MRYVDSRAKSSDKRLYFNRGTELFFNVRVLLERHELIIEINDKMLTAQLSGRYYKLVGGTIRQLLSKLEQRSKGYPSPDRADGFNLAFWDYKSTRVFSDYSNKAPDKPFELQIEEKPVNDFSLKAWASSDQSSLNSFRESIRKQQPLDHLQKELARYTESIKV